ncbi:MAG TPA: IS630 family transposase [Candidatus Competibacteraceae bacterium]|nr:IS630 family transposase [Candidatus Competibacteraceae bacterium]
MSRTVKIEIKESEEELKEMMNQQTHARFLERLQMLYWIKTKQFESLQETADRLGRSKSVLVCWLRNYRRKGLTGLLEWNYHGGRQSKLSGGILEALQQRLQDPLGGFRSYKEVKVWLFEEQGLEMPYSTVHRMVRYELDAKLKVARPTSIERDEAAVAEFQKNLPYYLDIIDIFQNVDGNLTLPLRYWSQDESRFGLKTITRSVLTALGVKPIGHVQWLFKSFYIYGAVEPLTGASFFLEFSHLDLDCFQNFLNQFSEAYPDSLNVIQLDNGRFHSAKKNEIPKNVILLFQPPYSPDINPIERVWQSFKEELSWFKSKNLDDLRKEVDKIIQSITEIELASLTGYNFIIDALK